MWRNVTLCPPTCEGGREPSYLLTYMHHGTDCDQRPETPSQGRERSYLGKLLYHGVRDYVRNVSTAGNCRSRGGKLSHLFLCGKRMPARVVPHVRSEWGRIVRVGDDARGGPGWTWGTQLSPAASPGRMMSVSVRLPEPSQVEPGEASSTVLVVEWMH